MTTEKFVILPDGSLDPSASHLIPTDMALVPLHPDVDLGDVFRPEFAEFSDSYLGIYSHDRIDLALVLVGRQRITVDRERLRGAYGNVPNHDGRYETISDALADGQVVIVDGLPWYPVISRDGAAQARYRDMRRAGSSHKWSEMIATRSFPGIKTDAVFNEGKFSGQSTGECTPHGVWLRAQAEAAGVSTTGKWYCSGLASFPGDPTAWVDSRGDVLRIAREKNMNVHGYVEHSGHETDPGNDEVIADDIIEDEVQDILEANPFADADAVREEVYQLRTGAVDNNPLLCQDYTSTDIP